MEKNRLIQVVYDDGCRSCSAAVVRLKRADRAGRFRLIGLSDRSSLGPPLADLPAEDLYQRLHLTDRSGTIRTGAAAIATILRQFPLTWPLGLLLSIPGIRFFAERYYDRFARRRHRAACTRE